MRAILAAALLTAAACGSARPPEAPPATPASPHDPVALLQALIRINTYNNPERGHPGNELALVRYVEGLLRAEGIQRVKIFETAPGRGCLVARLPGDGSEKPFLMMAHVDTVDVEPGRWTADPLGGAVKDGFLYGRGAIDDKGMAACEIAAFLAVHKAKVPLSRDVILLLTADEEAGGALGVKYMVEHHFDEIRAAFAINEGGKTVLHEGRVQYVSVQCTEKSMHNATLTATGTGGHSSRPHGDSAIDKLARAVARLAEFRSPVKLSDVTTGYFRGQAELSEGETAAHYRRLGQGDAAAAAAFATDPAVNSLLRSTAAVTILQAGIRFNVIPSEAKATLNIRLLPGEDLDVFLESMREYLGRPKDLVLAAEVPREKREAEPSPSPAEGPLFEAIRRTAAALHPGAVVMPSMSSGATDSRDLRLKGIPSYGLLPFPLDEEELKRMHGNDERIPVEALPKGVEFITRLILEVAAR